jgi:hypothetical protein
MKASGDDNRKENLDFLWRKKQSVHRKCWQLFTKHHAVTFQKTAMFIVYKSFSSTKRACGSVMVKALCYKPEGQGFDTRWGEFLNLPNPSGRTRPWGLLSMSMSTRNIKIRMLLGSKVQLVHRANNLTAICELFV